MIEKNQYKIALLFLNYFIENFYSQCTGLGI